MPKRSLRTHLLTRLSSELRAVGELGLALLMTAGVASCGGRTVLSSAGDAGAGAKDVDTKDASTATEGSVIDGFMTLEGGVVIDGPPGVGFEGGVIDGHEQVEGGVVDGPAHFDGGVIDGPAQVEGGVIDGPPPGH
jgi:hypothetical protein